MGGAPFLFAAMTGAGVGGGGVCLAITGGFGGVYFAILGSFSAMMLTCVSSGTSSKTSTTSLDFIRMQP